MTEYQFTLFHEIVDSNKNDIGSYINCSLIESDKYLVGFKIFHY